MGDVSDMYYEEQTPANELKGFTKEFQKRSKEKKEEDINVKELLGYVKEGNVILGAKVTEKAFKNNNAKKIFTASNADDLMKRKIEYYAKLANIECVTLDLNSEDLGQKLGKPFLISMACVVGGKK